MANCASSLIMMGCQTMTGFKEFTLWDQELTGIRCSVSVSRTFPYSVIDNWGLITEMSLI